MLDFHAWTHYISLYGYLAIFLLSVIEGPLVTVFAALLAARGYFNVYAVFATVVAGDLAGDVLIYSLGRWLIRRLPWHSGLHFHAFRHRLQLLQSDIRKRAGHYLLIGKLTHAIGFAVLLAAGVARIRFTIYILFNLLGTLPKSLALVLLGYFFGYYYQDFSERYQSISLIALVLGILLAMYMSRRIWFLDSLLDKPD